MRNINPDNLVAAKKKQNKITEYRKMLLAWKGQGILTLAGYILGFPADTPASIKRDIEIIQRELPVDIIEFFCLTPLPGSEDHQKLWRSGAAMDPDLNIYDIEHVCTSHGKMSKTEWERAYRDAWGHYYTPQHMRTLLKRGVATGLPIGSLAKLLVLFSTAVYIEKVHPLQSGVLRLKTLAERRPGLPPKSAIAFWPEYIWQSIVIHARLIGAIVGMTATAIAIAKNPTWKTYTDAALTPVADDEDEKLDLLTKTAGASAAVHHIRHVAGVVHSAGRTQPPATAVR